MDLNAVRMLVQVAEARSFTVAAGQLGLTCDYQEGAEQDTVSFERMGVKGTMLVSGTDFDLNIKLGMMMAPLRSMIEAEVSKSLGRIIEKVQGQA